MNIFFVNPSVARGNTHILLGMNIEINDSDIQVNTVGQLEDCIEMFGKDVSTSVTYPETKKIFKVREDAEQLNEKKG